MSAQQFPAGQAQPQLLRVDHQRIKLRLRRRSVVGGIHLLWPERSSIKRFAAQPQLEASLSHGFRVDDDEEMEGRLAGLNAVV
jgi:hypothetical protein